MRHESDCTAAVLASLFEIPIAEMPDFWKARGSETGFYARVNGWLATRGYHWYYSIYGGTDCPLLRDFVKQKTAANSSFPPRGYWVAQISSVDRLRDDEPSHAVVMKGRRLVFNPGGSAKQALEGPWFLIGYYLLQPLDPARLSLAEEAASGAH